VPLAAYKDLCIDADDPTLLALFWGAVLGLRVDRLADGDAVLRGDEPTDTIWVNGVPESKAVKHRVHMDLTAASLDPIVALGATVVLPASESGFPWTVMADPEGGEFCVFVRDEGVPADPPARLHELVIDTADAKSSQALAAWWAEALGGRQVDDGRGFWWVEDIPGFPFAAMDIVPVPEPKAVKNRIHWDVTSDHLPALLDRGATVLAEPTRATPWHVCADPQGNEFCVFPPP
jgi:catechol 2,3-dioxygenase-like lactoylglutathione lyase family enzyme